MGDNERRIMQKYLTANYQLIVIDGGNPKNRVYYDTDYDICPNKIYILLKEEHYSFIRSMTGYLDNIYYCGACHFGYDKKLHHKCEKLCQQCYSNTQCKTTYELMDCNICHRSFYGHNCYTNHIANNLCKEKKKCENCELEYNAKEKHTCDQHYCNNCHEKYTEIPHYCILKPLDNTKLEKEDKKLKFFVTYDIECRQEKESNKKS